MSGSTSQTEKIQERGTTCSWKFVNSTIAVEVVNLLMISDGSLEDEADEGDVHAEVE